MNTKNNSLKVEDIRIGMVLQDKVSKFPMRVVGIWHDGTIQLDFDGNEGDIWEEDLKDLELTENETTVSTEMIMEVLDAENELYDFFERAADAGWQATKEEYCKLIQEKIIEKRK